MTVVFSPTQPVVKKNTTLLAVEPLFDPASGRFPTSAVRYSFIKRPDGSGWRTLPNGECANEFQGEPPFPNRSIPAAGAALRQGDYFSVNVYVAIDQMPEGVAELRGVRLVYETDGRRFQQTTARGALRIASHKGVAAPRCPLSGWFDPSVPLAPDGTAARRTNGKDWTPSTATTRAPLP